MVLNLPNNHKDKGDINNATRYHAFTLNNYTKEQEETLQNYAIQNNNIIQYIIYSKEKGKNNQTPHLQGGILTFNRIRPKTLKNNINIKELHIEKCKKPFIATYRYCVKIKDGEDPNKIIWEYPCSYDECHNKSTKKSTFEETITLAKEGKTEEIPFHLRIKYDKEIKKVLFLNKRVKNLFYHNKYGNFFKTFNVLLWGGTGQGKTYRVDLIVSAINDCYKNYICPKLKVNFKELQAYDKLQLKYWDEYNGEEIVIIEELNPEWFQKAETNIKRWFDSKPFKAEIKGGTLNWIRPLFFILTSNYNLLELCSQNNDKFNPNKLLYPMERRILQINVKSRTQDVNFPDYEKLYLYHISISKVLEEYNKEREVFINNRRNNPKFQKLLNENPIEEEQQQQEPQSERECDTPQENVPIIIEDNYEPINLEEIELNKPSTSEEPLPRLGKRGIDYEYTENLPGYEYEKNKKQKNN